VAASYVERLRGNRVLTGALSAITAAVLGVILYLAVWLALHTVFAEMRLFSAGSARVNSGRRGLLLPSESIAPLQTRTSRAC
jgi:chromate transporter